MTGRGIRRQPGETWEGALRRLAPADRRLAAHYKSRRAIGMSEEESALSAALKYNVAQLLGDDE